MITVSEFFRRYDEDGQTLYVRCTSKAEDQQIRELFHAAGKRWSAGQSYAEESYWEWSGRTQPEKTTYFSNQRTWTEHQIKSGVYTANELIPDYAAYFSFDFQGGKMK